jgi:hypothetical protein
MNDLSTRIIHHDLYRLIPCCLCGAEWDEQWVGVTLFVREQPLGDLCPRCLNRSPQEGARRMRDLYQRLAHLYVQTRELLTASPPSKMLPDTVEELQAEAARVRERTEQLRNITKQRRALATEFHTISAQTQAQLLKLQMDFRRLREALRWSGGGTETDLPEVEVLEHGLVQLEHWPTKLAQVIQAERACFLQQVTGMEELFVRRAVDDRYHQFLASPA